MGAFYHEVRASMPYVARATRLFVPCFIFLTCFVAFFISGNDPTSLFYRAPRNPEKQWPYSSFRRAEASSIIEEAISIHNSGVNDTSAILKASPSQPPELCIGIATVARPNARYFSSAVGSLLHHLSPEERARIHLVLLVAHIDQRNHPAWSEGWVQILADTLLTYDTLPDAEIDRVKEMEVEGGEYRRKGLYDYAYLLDTCMQTGAPNVLVLEDDVVAMDGWFARTRAAVQAAHSVGKDWLYLRLFYTDTFMGWNGESWGTYLFHSVQAALLVAIATALAHFATFRSSNQGPSLRLHGYFAPSLLVLYVGLFLPCIILLFFAAGRLTVLPPASSSGIVPMPEYGCCSQGLLYPANRVPDVLAWLRGRDIGFVDEIIEEEASRRGELRWAMTRSVVQHVGSTSSKGDSDEPITEWVKSWQFEHFNAASLRVAQDRVIDEERRLAEEISSASTSEE